MNKLFFSLALIGLILSIAVHIAALFGVYMRVQ